MSLISDCLYVHNTKIIIIQFRHVVLVHAHMHTHMHTYTYTMTWLRRLGEDVVRSYHVSLCYEAIIYIAALLLLAGTYVHTYTYVCVFTASLEI